DEWIRRNNGFLSFSIPRCSTRVAAPSNASSSVRIERRTHMTIRTTGRRDQKTRILAAALAGAMALPVAARADDRPHLADAARGARTPIEHLVAIFQENVSFDHYFATYPNAANTEGSPFVAAAGTPLVNGLFPGGLLTHNPNSTAPFRLGPANAVTCDQGHG